MTLVPERMPGCEVLTADELVIRATYVIYECAFTRGIQEMPSL